MRCTGYDRPGIVYQVTEVLASAGFNIDELTTDTIRVSGKDGKTRPFFLLEGVVTGAGESTHGRPEKKLEGPAQLIGREDHGDVVLVVFV